MPEDQLAEAISEVRSSRETEALRARLPEILTQFALNITIIEPIQTVDTFNNDGANCCYCSIRERRICMSVAVVPSPHSKSRATKRPRAKRLELFWRDWETSSRYSIYQDPRIPTCIPLPSNTVVRRRQPLQAATTTLIYEPNILMATSKSNQLWKT
jgi:hypothetical protein